MSLAVLVLAVTGAAISLGPVENAELAAALAYQEEIARVYGEERTGFNIRVLSIPSVIDECGGSVESCPDVRLYIAVWSGDLGEVPSVFRLPPAKGWEFIEWRAPCPDVNDEPRAGFLTRTALPGANIDSSARSSWSPSIYEVCVGRHTATLVRISEAED